MKNFVSSILKVSSVLFLSLLAACNASKPVEPCEVHNFGRWHRTETEHFRKCKKCGYEERSLHDNGEELVCRTCADFKVLALGYLEGGDPAHADFFKEANEWFPLQGKENGFIYDYSIDFGKLNDNDLAEYDVVMFMNNYPGNKAQQEAFQRYMENGGCWIGWHVSAFTTEATSWNWYFNEFLGSGNFKSNTWNPTPEILKVETHDHFATANLPRQIHSSHNEWYSWSNDLRANEDITVLLSLDPSTFPVGDRVGEIWQTYVDVPVAWANNNYNMIYINMGHNLMDYNDFEKESKTFSSEEENEFILESLIGLVDYR